MKRISSLCLSLIMTAMLFAAETQYLPISVVVEPMAEPFPATAQLQVKNKLTQLLTRNGISSMDYLNQFFITVFAVPQSRDVIPGPPMKIAETMDLTFYIADYTNQIVFASTSQTIRGVGDSETKSYMDAIKRININSPAMAAFVEEGRKKILDYYEHEAENILKRVKMLISTKQYEAAMALAITIPQQCSKYDEALAVAMDAFRAYQQQQCYELLGQARQAWAAEQNATGAAAAGEYLALITPDMGCYDEAMSLYSEIKGKVLDDWKFEMKQYQDEADLKRAQVEAMRAVGVAYGEHQQPVSTNIGFLRN